VKEKVADVKLLTDRECAAWCERHGFKTGSSEYRRNVAPQIDSGDDDISLDVDPSDSVRLLVELGKTVARELASGGAEQLVWFTDWEINTSFGSHMALMRALRADAGNQRELIEAPGHLCGVDDVDAAASSLVLALTFGWDVHAFAPSKPVFVASHDGWRELRAVEPSGRAVWREKFSLWGSW
jgi:hypothetical protein